MGQQELCNKDDPSVGVGVNSSIALLQERFRQVQKVKKMREERELVKFLSLSSSQHHGLLFNATTNTTTCVLFEPNYSVSTRFFPHGHDQNQFMMMQSPTTTSSSMLRMLPQTCLSLWPTTSSARSSSQDHKKLGGGGVVADEVPALKDLWAAAASADDDHDMTTTSTSISSSSCDSAISLITKLDDYDHHCNSHDSDTDVDTSLHL